MRLEKSHYIEFVASQPDEREVDEFSASNSSFAHMVTNHLKGRKPINVRHNKYKNNSVLVNCAVGNETVPVFCETYCSFFRRVILFLEKQPKNYKELKQLIRLSFVPGLEDCFKVRPAEKYHLYLRSFTDFLGDQSAQNKVLPRKDGKIDVIGLIKEFVDGQSPDVDELFEKDKHVKVCATVGGVVAYRFDPTAYEVILSFSDLLRSEILQLYTNENVAEMVNYQDLREFAYNRPEDYSNIYWAA